MTPQKANNAIVISTLVTLGSTGIYGLTEGGEASITKGKVGKLSTDKTLIGGLFAMLGCAVLAELDPDLGGYLAIAIATTAFTLYGIQDLEHYFSTSQKRKEELRTPKVEQEKLEKFLHQRPGETFGPRKG